MDNYRNKNSNIILTCVIVLLIIIAILLAVLVGMNLRDNFGKEEMTETNISYTNDTIEEKPEVKPQPVTSTVKEEKKPAIDYNNVKYIKYKNHRYGFTIEYPDFLIPQPGSSNGDGQVFLSEDGKIRVFAWGTWGPLLIGETPTLEGVYEEAMSYLEYVPSYKFKKNNTFVFSGEKGDTVYYERHFLKSDGCENVLEITYPKSLEKEMNKIVTHLSNTMKTGVGEDSGVEK